MIYDASLEHITCKYNRKDFVSNHRPKMTRPLRGLRPNYWKKVAVTRRRESKHRKFESRGLRHA